MLESHFLIENLFFSFFLEYTKKAQGTTSPLHHHCVLEAVSAEKEKTAAVCPMAPGVSDVTVHTFCALIMHLGILP